MALYKALLVYDKTTFFNLSYCAKGILDSKSVKYFLKAFMAIKI